MIIITIIIIIITIIVIIKNQIESNSKNLRGEKKKKPDLPPL
jgi:hypothetical protein